MKRIGAWLLAVAILSAFMIGCTSSGDVSLETEAESVQYIYDSEMVQTSTDSRAAFSEKGYYYLVNGFLYFYDVNSDVSIPVCSKSDCLHDSVTCSAYALDKVDYDPYDLKGVSVNCLGNSVWYDNGKLYMIKRDEAGDYLMQYDSDYTNEIKVCTLADKGTVIGAPNGSAQDMVLMYKGYLYYYTITPVHASELVDNTATITCNRIKVAANSKREELGTFEMAIDYAVFSTYAVGKVCAGDDCVYFVNGGTTRWLSKNDPVQYRICLYDCNRGSFKTVLNKNADNTLDVLGEGTGEVQTVRDDIVCADDENNLYIVTDESKIVKITPEGKSEVIYRNGNAQGINSLVWDGTHVYFYEKTSGAGAIVRIDKNGNKMGRYNITINTEFFEEKYISGTKSVDIKIYGVDSQNIVVYTDNDYIKGLECSTLMKNSCGYVRTYAVGIIRKDALDDSSGEIRKIYEYSGYLDIQ